MLDECVRLLNLNAFIENEHRDLTEVLQKYNIKPIHAELDKFDEFIRAGVWQRYLPKGISPDLQLVIKVDKKDVMAVRLGKGGKHLMMIYSKKLQSLTDDLKTLEYEHHGNLDEPQIENCEDAQKPDYIEAKTHIWYWNFYTKEHSKLDEILEEIRS